MKRLISMLLALVLVLGALPLTVLAAEPPIIITEQPKSVTVEEGKMAVVTVGATGDGLTYKWYYKNVGMSSYVRTDSFKTNTYKVEMNAERNGRQVLCRVYDKHGNVVQTNTVKLSMACSLQITAQPQSVAVAAGEMAVVTVGATGDGLTYKWYYKNVGESSYTYTSSYKGDTYKVQMNEERNGRQVLCRVYDKYGNVVQTNTVKLSMMRPVQITAQPQSVTVADGKMAVVTVGATGDGLTYMWYYKNVGMSEYVRTDSYKTNTYKVEMNAERDGRQVLCRVYDKYGNVMQTNTVKLSMEHPVQITAQPQSVTVAEGEMAIVTVGATGDGLTYKWYYKDAGASTYTYTSSFKGNTYKVTMNAARDGRQILCRVYDQYNNVVQTNTVKLSMAHPAQITAQPADVSALYGEEAVISVQASGDGLIYQWTVWNEEKQSFIGIAGANESTLSIIVDESWNGARVCCEVTDAYGTTVVSDVATVELIIVTDEDELPPIDV